MVFGYDSLSRQIQAYGGPVEKVSKPDHEQRKMKGKA